MSLTKTVAEIALGDHACIVVDSDEQHWEVAAGYVIDGLARREKVLYFDGERSAVPLLRRLRENEVDVDRVLRSGQLVMAPPEIMMSMWERSVEDVEVQVRHTIDEALDEGYDAVRLTDEPAAGAHRPIDRLGELDQMIHEVIQNRPATMLCQYERRHWSGSELERLGELHPVEVVAPSLYDDGLLRVTRLGPFHTRVAGEIDLSNRDVVRLMIDRELDGVLRAVVHTGQVEMWLESLRFADVTSVVQFVHAAAGFPESHQLVLHGVRPAVRRLLDRCGASFSNQLVVREDTFG